MFDEGKIGRISVKGLRQIGVFGTFVSLGDEGEKEGNLELSLGDVNAIEKTIELGVTESGFEFGIGGSFFGEELIGVFARLLIVLSVVSVEARSGTGESAREGIGDGTQIGRFKIAIVILKDGAETGGAIIELVDVLFGIGFGEIDDEGDSANKSKTDETTEENFGDEAGLGAGGFAGNRARSLRNMVEILKIIHMLIIAEYSFDAKKSMIK